MPRSYKRKTVTTYNEQDLLEALREVKDKKCSIRGSAKKFNIPFDTLRRYVINPPTKLGSGRCTYLTAIEEECLVRAMQYTAACGYPFDRADLITMVESYLLYSGKTSVFPKGTPGPDWVRNFEKRWSKELGKRKPEILTKSRANSLVTDVIDEFYATYENILIENNLLDQPHRIFNVDETGLATNPISCKVYVEKRSRNSYMECPTGGKAMYTVLFCVSATGQYMAPLVVYKGKNLYDTWIKGGPDGACYAVSPSGWMQDDVFEKWIEHFIKNIKKINVKLPVLLTFDGHGSHLTYGTVKQALDNQIIIVCLPPNTSHALQPLDVGVFGPLKLNWKAILKAWYRESRMQSVSKAVFPSLLRKLFEKLPSENGVGGFRGSGLFPPNKEVMFKRMLKTKAKEPTANNVVKAGPSTSRIPTTVSPINENESSIGSPFKHIKAAVISTLSPTPSSSIKEAMKNAKRKRTRMQNKAGEVLTTKTTLKRLYTEKIKRDNRCKTSSKKYKQDEMFSSEDPIMDGESIEVDQSLKVGKWVLVELCGKKSRKTFHGIILTKNEDSLTVKFAKKTENSYFVFPEKDDISEVDESQIIEVLPDPEMNHRGQYFFLQM